jgi:hypothetical protein
MNAAVDATSAKTLVSFSTHEARAAWKTGDTVFDDRLIKVFWHLPMPVELRDLAGQRALGVSRPLRRMLPPSTVPSLMPNHRLRVVLVSRRRRSHR